MNDPIKCAKKDCIIKFETGLQLFDRLSVLLRIFLTGSEKFDEVLDGGIWTGEVTEIVGPISAGKSQLCYSLMASVLLRATTSDILLLDSNGSFRPSRLLQILRHYHPDLDDETVTRLLSRVVIQRPVDCFQLISCLENILNGKLKKDAKKEGNPYNFRVLIVDSAGCLLALTVLGQQSPGWHSQAQVCRLLKRCAAELAMAVIVVNHMVYPWNESPRPALGQWWASFAHTKIRMEPVGASKGEIIVKVLKSVRKNLEPQFRILLFEGGIKDCDLMNIDLDGGSTEPNDRTCDNGDYKDEKTSPPTSDYEGGSPTF